MNLNNSLLTEQSPTSVTPVLLIHGLFGSLDNLGLLARGLQQEYPVIQVDVRNHGLSPRAEQMSYHQMAQDMLDTLDALDISRVSVIGHSMGGKIAMTMATLAAERLEQLVVIDIAPVAYPAGRHEAIFSAIHAVTHSGVKQRSDAAHVLRENLSEEGVIQFLLKSFHQGEWRFNVAALEKNYADITGWNTLPAAPHPTLFIRGQHSSYLDDSYRDTLLQQFPAAKAHVIHGAGHWVHAEKSDAVLRAIRRFLTSC